jgi:hypothetical protein
VNKLDPDSESPATERLGRIYIHHVRRLQPDEQDGDSVGYGTSSHMEILFLLRKYKNVSFFKYSFAFSFEKYKVGIKKHTLVLIWFGKML